MPRPVYQIKRCDCTCAEQVSPCNCAGCPACYNVTVPVDGEAAFRAANVRGDFVVGNPAPGAGYDTFTATDLVSPISLSAAGVGTLGFALRMYLDLTAGTLDLNYILGSSVGDMSYTLDALLYDCTETTGRDEDYVSGDSLLTSLTGDLHLTVPATGRYLLLITLDLSTGSGPGGLSSVFELSGVTMTNVGFCYVEGGGPPLP